jgi:hypothetical protein
MTTVLRRGFVVAIVAFTCLATTQYTHAKLIGFNGTVTEVTQPAGVPDPGLFSVGDLLSGSYTFDASTLRTDSLETLGIYSYSDTDMAFALGTKSGSSPTATSVYGDNTQYPDPAQNPLPRDLFNLFARQEQGLVLSGLGDWSLIDFDVILEDFSNSAVPPGSPGNFLVDPVDASLFPSNRFVLSFSAGSAGTSFEVIGTVESFAVVPIPPALWLFGSGLLGLIGVARRNAA